MDTNSDIETEYLIVDTTWGDDSTIEFLQLIQNEPCIWDPQHKHNRNRLRKHDAWIRIQQNFSVPCTMEELKRKRNSLMTTYREKLRRMKGSAKPSWFAFDVMHSYLGPVYCSIAIEQESHSTRKRRSSQPHSILFKASINKAPESQASVSKQPESEAANESSSEIQSEQECTTTKIHKPNTGSDTSEDSEDGDLKDHKLERWLWKVNHDVNKECNVYGQLVAEKLKKLQDEDRVMLMNEINSLMSKYEMEST